MYYVALRNVGVNAIKNGNLEVGLYHFAVAEQIGPIDTDAEAYRVWAKMYLNSASNWGVNWGKVVLGFSELYPLVPNLIDFNGKTVKQRYAEALAGYGDSLEALYQWCDAVTQYETSTGIASIQTVIDKLPEARANCANPPNTPTPAEIATP